MQQTMGIVMGLDDWKPWGQEDQVKVGCHLMQLLIETAYIQPPVNQLGDGPPDILCPAFKHNLKTVTTDSQKDVKRYGVIEGLEKAARHMVIPYMPMLVPPTAYTCINIYLQFVWKQVVQLLSSDLSVHKEESSSARQHVLQIMHTPRPPTN